MCILRVGVKVAKTLLANYFFMSELLILSLLDLQNWGSLHDPPKRYIPRRDA